MGLNYKSDLSSYTKAAPLPRWSSWQVVAGTMVVVAVAAAFWLLIRFYELLFILIVSIILGIVIKPATLWLERHGISRSLSVILVYLAVFIPVALIIWFSAPLLIAQSAQMADALAESYSRAHQRLLGSTSLLMRRLAVELPAEVVSGAAEVMAPPAPDSAEAVSEAETATAALASLWATVAAVLRSLVVILMTFVLTYYWTVESDRLQKTFLLLIPAAHRQSMQDLGQAIEQKLSRYLVGQMVLCGVIGTLAFLLYLLLDLPNALLLALFAGLMEAVPNIGPIIGAIPALIIAFSVSPTAVVGVLVGSGIIQLAENYLLVPRIMGQAMGVRPLVILLAWLAFSSFFGVAGAVVAIPLAVVLQLVVERAVLKPGALEERPPRGRDRISVIRYEIRDLVDDVRQQIRRKEDVATASSDQIEDSIEAIAMDLDSVLAQYDEEPEEPVMITYQNSVGATS